MIAASAAISSEMSAMGSPVHWMYAVVNGTPFGSAGNTPWLWTT